MATGWEVKEGLKEGDEVLLNPQPLKALRKPAASGQSQLGSFGTTDIVVRTMRSTEPGSATRIERYGLTLADLVRIEGTVPDVALMAPLRQFPTMNVRSLLTGNHPFDVVATTPAYGIVHRLDDYLVEESHRFLVDLDEERFAAVVVLGAEPANSLFPREDPLGQTVRISGHPFRVVGVLGKRPAPHNREVYIPLATSRQLFGKVITVRRTGSFRREEVDLTEIQLVLRNPSQTPKAAAAVRGMLNQYHDQQDWQVTSTFD